MRGQDWKRLGTYVTWDRLTGGYATVRALAEVTGVHEKTLGKLENGIPVSRNTLMAVARVLDWTPQSADDVLGGGTPTHTA